MLVTIKSANHVWTAPDGQMKIWEFTGVYPDSGEQMQGATRSQRIATSIDQTLDLTTTVSKSGKTYYVQVPREGSGGFVGAREALPGLQPSQGAQGAPGATERFIAAVERFEKAVDMLAGLTGPQSVQASPKVDRVPTDEEIKQAAEYFGGEVIDDL